MSCEKLMLTSEIKAVGIIKMNQSEKKGHLQRKQKTLEFIKIRKRRKKAINQILSRGERAGWGA
jgi:superfamily I DNA and/or RNA helicase